VAAWDITDKLLLAVEHVVLALVANCTGRASHPTKVCLFLTILLALSTGPTLGASQCWLQLPLQFITIFAQTVAPKCNEVTDRREIVIIPELTGYPLAAKHLEKCLVPKNTVRFLVFVCRYRVNSSRAIDLQHKTEQRWYIAQSAIALQGSSKMGPERRSLYR
jgi:hypothetical protein